MMLRCSLLFVSLYVKQGGVFTENKQRDLNASPTFQGGRRGRTAEIQNLFYCSHNRMQQVISLQCKLNLTIIFERQGWHKSEKAYSTAGNKFLLSTERQSIYPTIGNQSNQGL